jgi:Rps23 Pro-64 3,4-dihydroxylase Tpa1-like proline 4-hydroxylase
MSTSYKEPTFEETSADWVVKRLHKGGKDALIIDNWYSKEELRKVFVEFDYYMNNGLDNLIKSETDSSTARAEDGGSKAKTYRFYVEPNKFSALYRYNYKYMSDEFSKMLLNDTIFGGYLKNTHKNSLMVNYYENDKYYKSHRDVSVVTQLTWLFREPKMFTGGDLVLTDMDETIDCVHNRTVFFPGFFPHEVTKVTMTDEWEQMDDVGKWGRGYHGRFSVANFFN